MNFIEKYKIDKKICDGLIDFFNKSKVMQHKGGFFKGNKYVIDKKTKDCSEITLSQNTTIEEYKKYVFALAEQLRKYKKKYTYCDKGLSSWTIVEPANIQHYEPGGAYHGWHTERTGGRDGGQKRHLVFMTYLNDVTEGGETEWYYQKLKIKPKKGLTVIWPADWTYQHRGVPSKTQHKYIITGWFSFIH